jgi:hypothetical protein
MTWKSFISLNPERKTGCVVGMSHPDRVPASPAFWRLFGTLSTDEARQFAAPHRKGYDARASSFIRL